MLFLIEEFGQSYRLSSEFLSDPWGSWHLRQSIFLVECWVPVPCAWQILHIFDAETSGLKAPFFPWEQGFPAGTWQATHALAPAISAAIGPCRYFVAVRGLWQFPVRHEAASDSPARTVASKNMAVVTDLTNMYKNSFTSISNHEWKLWQEKYACLVFCDLHWLKMTR